MMKLYDAVGKYLMPLYDDVSILLVFICHICIMLWGCCMILLYHAFDSYMMQLHAALDSYIVQ